MLCIRNLGAGLRWEMLLVHEALTVVTQWGLLVGVTLNWSGRWFGWKTKLSGTGDQSTYLWSLQHKWSLGNQI